MDDERKRQIMEYRRNLYQANQELLEIDPNLIIHIKLKWSDRFSIINFVAVGAYIMMMGRFPHRKRLLYILPPYFFAQFHLYKYYFTQYPFLLLKNTKEALQKAKEKGEDIDLVIR